MNIFAAHFDSWIFLLLVGMAALLRLLASKASGPKDAGPSNDQPPLPRPADRSPSRPVQRSDEEQIRKFLEALGQPATSSPPSPVTPRSDIPPRPVAPVKPPPGVFPTMPGAKRVLRERRPERGATLRETARRTTKEWLRKINLPEQPAEAAASVTELQPRDAPDAPPEPSPVMEPLTEAYAIAPPPKASAGKAKSDLAILLASPSGLRSAIILREIFGPPRSLQPLEDRSGTT